MSEMSKAVAVNGKNAQAISINKETELVCEEVLCSWLLQCDHAQCACQGVGL